MTERLVDPADRKQEQRGGDNGQKAAEDEVLGSGKKDVPLITSGTGGGNVDATMEQKLVFTGAEEDGMGADKKEAYEDAGEGEGVGKQVTLPINDE